MSVIGSREDKTAPWRRWEAVPVIAREVRRPRERRVEYVVDKYDPARNQRYSELISDAAWSLFHIHRVLPARQDLAAYVADGQLRLVYRELIVRFGAEVASNTRDRILANLGLVILESVPYTVDEWIVCHREADVSGESALELAERLAERPEVIYAWPDSVTEFERNRVEEVGDRDWHLEHIGVVDGRGDRQVPAGAADIIVAIVDDGVDLEHPNLANRLCATPDPSQPLDTGGRDFNFASSAPAHFDPRAKLLSEPGASGGSDHHGTQCAGLIVSDATQEQYSGVVPGCRFVSVRVMNGSKLIKDRKFAEALDYAASVADVISCSLTGSEHRKIKSALDNAVAQGRAGRGTAVFCATGNHAGPVKFPANYSSAIAVGACTDAGSVPNYSNFGPEVDFVAPAHGGTKSIFTTDVSATGKGESPTAFWDGFGGTSAATAIAAGVGALCLSVDQNLTAADLRNLLRQTARNTGNIPDPKSGYGRINAAAAVAAV